MRIGVIGIGHGKFGRRNDATVQELAYEPFQAALDDGGIGRDDVDSVVVGSVPEYHKQRSLPGVVAEYIGMNPKPAWLTEAASVIGVVIHGSIPAVFGERDAIGGQSSGAQQVRVPMVIFL